MAGGERRKVKNKRKKKSFYTHFQLENLDFHVSPRKSPVFKIYIRTVKRITLLHVNNPVIL